MLELLENADSTRPLVTFYDDATGERVEFSGRTLANWVAKTANLLVDGLAAEPGDRAELRLPPHWQTVVWLLACWAAGLEVVQGEPGADVLVVTEADLPVPDRARDLVGLSLHAMGMPMATDFPGVVDYAAEVRSYGDGFQPPAPLDPERPVLSGGGQTFTSSGLLTAAREYGFETGARVLTLATYDSPTGLLAGLLGPLSMGGSVVIVRNPDPTLLDRRVGLENVTDVVDPDKSIHRQK